jgi:MoxR-like ATPase
MMLNGALTKGVNVMVSPARLIGRKVLRSLNIFGLDHLDPIILAALADEQPLLLIGAHGTAKSALLNRIAEMLELKHRHYNASLISFDDLLGYPVPNAEKNGLTYLRTENDLWDAESVFLDEISRCRPESQNKLFSVIHERRVQGLSLKNLKFRWAAMNPPLSPDSEEVDDDEIYSGSLPLDPALADRFPWVVVIPKLSELPKKDRLSIIRSGDAKINSKLNLTELIREVRDARSLQSETDLDWAVEYVGSVLTPLEEAGFTLSGRRAAFLARNIMFVHSAQQVLGRKESISSSAYLALKWGLPQRALGRTLNESKLNAIHKLALQTAGEPISSPWHAIRSTSDLVKRVAIALPFAGDVLSKHEFSNLVTDAYSSLSLPKRYIFSRRLLPSLATSGAVNVPAFELLSSCATKVAEFCNEKSHTLELHRSKLPEWKKLIGVVSRLEKNGPDSVNLGNYLLTIYAVEKEVFDPEEIIELDEKWGELFSSNSP